MTLPSNRVTMPKAVRPATIAERHVHVAHRPDGAILLTPVEKLAPYPTRFTQHLEYWAQTAPERCMVAERAPTDGWARLTYAQAWHAVQSLAQALLSRGLSAERPLMVLSGNSIQHLLLSLAAMHVGIPSVPVSTAYAPKSGNFEKLRAITALVTPGFIYVPQHAPFAAALAALPTDIEQCYGAPDDCENSFKILAQTQPTQAVARAAAQVTGQTIAKIMFTSGSTGAPKAVPTTHQMLCSNQQMLKQAWGFLAEKPPILLDWLPWSHTFGGSHNVGMAIANGGTFYIDDGRPVPGGFEATIRNLREIAPTLYLNVPKAYEELVPWLQRDSALREKFFSEIQMIFYSGASLQPAIWEAMDQLAEQTIGQRIQWMTSLGCTESSPAALSCSPSAVGAGIIGHPLPGVELKLAPVGDKLEARLRGPNIMQAYWRNEAASRAAFDDEGFYQMGDALTPVIANDFTAPLRFDGRVAEDFKLSSGTWVFVGHLRLQLLAALSPHVKDIVIAAPDRPYLALLAIPAEDFNMNSPSHRQALREKLIACGKGAGSAARPLRIAFLTAPLSVDSGELTDKGSISQRTILRLHAPLVEKLYQDPLSPDIIAIA